MIRAIFRKTRQAVTREVADREKRLAWLDSYLEREGRLEHQIALFNGNHAYRLVVRLPSASNNQASQWESVDVE